MSHSARCFIVGILGLIAAVDTAHSGVSPGLRGIGVLNNGDGSAAMSLSGDGRFAIGYSVGTTFYGVRWSQAGGLQPFSNVPNATAPLTVDGVNGDGSVFCGQVNGTNGSPAIWTSPSQYVLLPVPGGTVLGRAFSLSAAGDRAGGFIVTSGPTTETKAVRWNTLSTMPEVLPNPNTARGSVAVSISDLGGTVVGYSEYPSQGNRATVWRQGQSPLSIGPFPGGRGSTASGVSGDGQVVVGSAGASFASARPFKWTASTGLIDLGGLSDGANGRAFDASFTGNVIVGESDGQAVIWLNSGVPIRLQTYATQLGIDVSGWTLASARGVSSDGQTIVGFGTRMISEGVFRNEGFVLTVPSPAALPVLLGGFLLGARRKRSH